MKGIKPHTHRDRQAVIKEIVPLIKKKFGRDLVALAAQGSYARGEDIDYSDLELIAFVKKMPRGKRWEGMGKIRDGLLVELLWTTRQTYLKEVRDIGEHWYLAGSDKLFPIINKPYILKLNKHRVKHLKKKALKHLVQNWNEVQEPTTKVLNAVVEKNREGIGLLVSDMYEMMLINLSFLNQKPYTTYSRFIAEAKRFKLRPDGFDELTDIWVKGDYQDLKRLDRAVRRVFAGFEKIFADQGIDLYDEDIDPNVPYRRDLTPYD